MVMGLLRSGSCPCYPPSIEARPTEAAGDHSVYVRELLPNRI